MAETVRIELASGRTVYVGAQSAAVSGLSQLTEVSLRAAAPVASAAQFEGALGSLGELVGVMQKQVAALIERPSKIEIEFGASLTGECNLWVVSGTGAAEFKVTLTWEKAP